MQGTRIIVKKDGYDYAFDPATCAQCMGNCCVGESGYIWVNPKEIKDIADFLCIEVDLFTKDYLKKIKYRYSIKEIQKGDSFECIFFDRDKKGCSIYPVRPSQCESFPFWDYFKDKISKVEKECPGIVRL